MLHGDFVMSETKNNKPSFSVYTVVKESEGSDPFWTNVGAAFPHKDGKGYNLVLRALPVDSRLVLREYQVKKE